MARRASPSLVWLAWVLGAAVFVLCITRAPARDLGQWEQSDPRISLWFKNLKQPDNGVSCCGEADAYWADGIEVNGEQVIAIITDDRPDEPLGRPHVPIGTKIVVPVNKLMRSGGNPTGHIVIFLGYDRQVYCYVTGTLS